jgi:hypothetical protein
MLVQGECRDRQRVTVSSVGYAFFISHIEQSCGHTYRLRTTLRRRGHAGIPNAPKCSVTVVREADMRMRTQNGNEETSRPVNRTVTVRCNGTYSYWQMHGMQLEGERGLEYERHDICRSFGKTRGLLLVEFLEKLGSVSNSHQHTHCTECALECETSAYLSLFPNVKNRDCEHCNVCTVYYYRFHHQWQYRLLILPTIRDRVKRVDFCASRPCFSSVYFFCSCGIEWALLQH